MKQKSLYKIKTKCLILILLWGSFAHGEQAIDDVFNKFKESQQAPKSAPAQAQAPSAPKENEKEKASASPAEKAPVQKSQGEAVKTEKPAVSQSDAVAVPKKKKKKKSRPENQPPTAVTSVPAASEKTEAKPKAEESTVVAPQKEDVKQNASQVPVVSEEPKEYGLFGDWLGLKKVTGEKGVDIDVLYKGELNRNLSGGLQRKTGYLQNLDVKMLVDADKLFGAKGWSFFVYGIGDWGASGGFKPSAYVGDAQGTSNIETATDNFKLYETWVQKKSDDEKISLLVGIHDLNSEFYATDSSGLFLNSSFGVGKEFSQTGLMGPSIFPNPTTAVRLKVEPSKSFYFESGVFNALAANPDQPQHAHYGFDARDGLLLINEAAWVGGDDNPYKYGIGFWHYTRTFDDTQDTVVNMNGDTVAKPVTSQGAYALIDQPLGKSFSVFFRAGTASAASNVVKDNLAAGLNYKAPFGREKDKVGLAATRISSKDPAAPAETTYELTYRMDLGRGLALQPDFQYVQNPSFSRDTQNAQYGALRIEIGF